MKEAEKIKEKKMQREGPLKRGIYNNNDKIIKFDNEDSKRNFDFLNDNKRRTYKQKELSEILGISKPKVSRLLGELVGKEKLYGKSKYMVVKKNREYTMVVLNQDEKSEKYNSNSKEEKRHSKADYP